MNKISPIDPINKLRWETNGGRLEEEDFIKEKIDKGAMIQLGVCLKGGAKF